MMTEAATVHLQDAGSAQGAVVIVRFDAVHVALCLSLERDGDLEVVMSKVDARKVMDALARAVGDYNTPTGGS